VIGLPQYEISVSSSSPGYSRQAGSNILPQAGTALAQHPAHTLTTSETEGTPIY